jgi:hypothetical protein
MYLNKNTGLCFLKRGLLLLRRGINYNLLKKKGSLLVKVIIKKNLSGQFSKNKFVISLICH